MRPCSITRLAILCGLWSVWSAPAIADDFAIDWFSIDGGGKMFTSGGDFELSGTMGQPDAGEPTTGGDFELVGGFWGASVLAPPRIIHGATGVSFADMAFGGYVDPRCNSGNPPFCNTINRIDSLIIVFNVEPFGDDQGGPVTPANFVAAETGGGSPPNVISVTKDRNIVLVELDRVVTYGQWTTVEANVFNAAGDTIQDLGNQGPGIDEPDRIDVGFLSGDIDQNGRTLPLDNTRFRQMFAGSFHNSRGVDKDYVDVNRDGSILPLDVTVWRINFNGWLFATLPAQP